MSYGPSVASREGEPRSTGAVLALLLLADAEGGWAPRDARDGRRFRAVGSRGNRCHLPVPRTEHQKFLALVSWMGFRQTSILYEKQARFHGRSGWTLRKKIKLVINTLTSFTYPPIRWMSLVGLIVSILGLILC